MFRNILILLPFVFFQQSFACEKITPEKIQKNNLNILFYSVNKNIKLDFSQYCEPNLSFSFSMINDLSTLKKMEKQIDFVKSGYEKKPGLLLLITSKFHALPNSEMKKIIDLQRKLNNDQTNYFDIESSINEKSFNKNKEEIINYLNTKYKNERFHDSQGNSELEYSLISNNYNLFNHYIHREINKFNTVNFDKKNIFGLSLYHLAFAPSLHGQNTKSINEVLINLLHEEHIQKLSFNSLSFFEYAYLLKDNNPDFYKKILKDYKLNEKNISQTQDFLHKKNNVSQLLKSNAFKIFTDI